MSLPLPLQASRLVAFLNDERIAALAACDWNRAERLDRLVQRARYRAMRRTLHQENIYALAGWNRRHNGAVYER